MPTALGLRRQGATPGATVAFLIATPETGVDSISLSYALTDPIMTVFRPMAAVVTAVSAGICINFFGARRTPRISCRDTVVRGGGASDRRRMRTTRATLIASAWARSFSDARPPR